MGSNIASRVTLLGMCGAVVLAAACGPSQEDFDARGARIEELEGQLQEASRRYQQAQEQIETLTAENGAMSERLTALGEDVSALRSRAGQLTTDLEEAQRRAEELARRERQHQERLATFRGMLCRFQAMIQSGRLRVRIVRGRMVIEMPSNILFRSGSANLSDEGEEALTEVAGVLSSIQGRDFQVAGHTDNVPIRRSRFRSNWQLSTARALEVVEFLQEHGVAPAHLSAAGYSEHAPSASNDSEEGRAANRRIEIVLMPNLDELPDLSGLESQTCAE
jgi:chemotaxis protein MotB